MSSAIEISNLDKHFGTVHAVKNISFDVRHGEVLGFLGPNGAGKSTTMKMITGFLDPSGGSVKVCGYDVVEQPIKAKQVIGYLPEGAPGYGEMTPLGFLQFIADIRGFTGGEKQRVIDEAVDKINLQTVLHRPIETLSKGFKRRVGIAQAILHDPQVLIMDEPTDGLDPNQKHEVRTLIKEMAKDKAIVISTHILEEVEAVCDRAIIIAEGALVFSGTPAELEAKSRLHNAVTLTLNSELLGQAQARLQQLDSVARVEPQELANGATRLLVLPHNGQPIVNEVSRVINDAGWQIEELQVQRGRLDEVFRTITTAGGEDRT